MAVINDLFDSYRMTAKNVEVGLTDPALLCWGHRGDYEVVVLCDLATNDKTFNENTCSLAHLKAALVLVRNN